MKLSLYILFILASFSLFGQGNICYDSYLGFPSCVTINHANSINICEENQTITFTVENPSPATFNNVTAQIDFFQGFGYLPGSVSGGTESDISNLSSPIISLSSINSNGQITFSIEFRVTCDVISAIDQGTVIDFKITLDYEGDNNGIVTNSNTIKTSEAINILRPNLSILSISNQVYSGAVGDNFQRCIEIINGGSGYLSNLSISETHSSDISINSIDAGTLSSSGNGSQFDLSGVDFSAFGDGDNLFETGEVVIICEDVTINNCQNAFSEYELEWGCDNLLCQSFSESSNIVFPNSTPQVNMEKIEYIIDPCYENGIQAKFLITNTGDGEAFDLRLDLFNAGGNGAGFWPGGPVGINASSFSASLNGAPSASIIDSIYETNATISGLCGSSVGGFVYNIASLMPGDSLIIEWTSNICIDQESCGIKRFGQVNYKLYYENSCEKTFQTGTKTGSSRIQSYATLNSANNNAVFEDLEQNTFVFGGTGASLYGSSFGSQFEIMIGTHPCISSNQGVFLEDNNGLIWNPDVSNQVGDSIYNKFSILTAPLGFSTSNFTLKYDVIANCVGCADKNGSVKLDLWYIPDSTCNTKLHLGCQSTNFTMTCQDCDTGLLLKDYSFERISFDLQDYNNDGIADNANKAERDSVDTKMALLGDTLKNVLTGYMRFPGGSTWDYCYAKLEANGGALMTDPFNQNLIIKKANGAIYNCNKLSYTATNNGGDKVTFLFNLSANSMIDSGCVPNGFLYEHGDSLFFESYFIIDDVPNNSIYTYNYNISSYNSQVEMSLHVNSEAEPTSEANRFTCFKPIAGLNILPLYYRVAPNNEYTISKSCDTLEIKKTFYYTIGDRYSHPCHEYFPNEFRNFGGLDSIIFDLPPDYNFIDAGMAQYFQDGTSGSCTNKFTSGSGNYSVNLVPDFSVNGKVIFDVGALYANGNLIKPDQTHRGYFRMRFIPTCTKIDEELDTLYSNFIWEEQKYNDTSVFPSIESRSRIKREAPYFSIQVDNPSLLAYDDTIAWILNIENLSSTSDASNFWIKNAGGTGVNLLRVWDMDNQVLLNDSNGFFVIENFQSRDLKKLMVVADFNNCYKDSIVIYTGWECSGVPNFITDYICEPTKTPLFVTPLFPFVETNILLDNDTVDLCDTATYTVTLKNVQLGTAYDLQLFGQVPTGLQYIVGSSKIKYNASTLFNNFVDPAQNPSGLLWDLSLYDSLIRTNGLKGILDTANTIIIEFKVLTSCNYVSGSQFKVYPTFTANCGDTLTQEISVAIPLLLRGAINPYSTKILLEPEFISPCYKNSAIGVKVINEGPNPTQQSDSIFIELPEYLNYVNGSYFNIYNGPGTLNIQDTNASIRYVNNVEVLSWKLPSNIPVGDSSYFTFDISSMPQLPCDLKFISASTTTTLNSACLSTGQVCEIQSITGDTTDKTFVYKSELEFVNASANSVLSAPNQEIITVDFDIKNLGESVSFGYPNTFQIYHDVDKNGVIDITDSIVYDHTTFDSLPGNGEITTLNFSTGIESSTVCNLIIVSDSSRNLCFCNSDLEPLPVKLDLELSDTAACSEESVQIGVESIINYQFLWSPTQNISNTNASFTNFVYSNTPREKDTFQYYLDVDRGGCFAYDTMEVIVHGKPIAIATEGDTFCEIDTVPILANQLCCGETGEWTSYSDSISTLSIDNKDTSNSFAFNLPEGNSFFVWSVDNGVCPVEKDTAEYQIHRIPIINSGVDQFLCDDDQTQLIGTYDLNGLNFLWGVLSSGGNPVFSDSLVFNPVISLLPYGESQVTFSASDGVCPVVIDTIEINNLEPHEASLPNDTSICGSLDVLVTANPVDLSNFETGTWSLDSNYNVVSTIIIDTNQMNVSSQIGEQRVIWGISSPFCPSDFDTMVIISFEEPISSVVSDIDTCYQNQVIIRASSYPLTATFSEWHIDSSFVYPSTPVIIDASNSTSLVSNLQVGEYPFIWAVDNGVCDADRDTLIIYNRPYPVSSFTISDSTICKNSCFDLINQSSIDPFNEIDSSFWTIGTDNFTLTDSIYSYCINIAGNYDIRLITTSIHGCNDTIIRTDRVEVFEIPIAGFEFSPPSCIRVLDRVSFTDKAIGATTYLYEFGDGSSSTLPNPTHYFEEIGIYPTTQIVSNENDCYDTITKNINVSESFDLYAPNTFTPDGDGINEVFYPIIIDAKEYQLTIFDRWGKIVFESNNPSKGWDGIYRGEMSVQDTYVWKVRYRDPCDNSIVNHKGHVNLLK